MNKLPDWIQQPISGTPIKLGEYSRLIEALAIAWEALEDVSGYDCHNYDKHLNPKPCGTCSSCVPRNALERIRELGDDGPKETHNLTYEETV